MSKLIIDCRHLHLYPVGQSGFSGGTERMVHVLAKGLAAGGHAVHVVCPDLEDEEERGERLTYWGPHHHPTRGDVVVFVGSLAGAEEYTGEAIVYATNGSTLPDHLDAGVARMVSAYPIFSREHGRLMCLQNPTIPAERCVVTGLGVDLSAYTEPTEDQYGTVYHLADEKVPGRIWVGNDPARGLVHVLDVFDLVRREIPTASLHVTYDFDAQFERIKWQQNAMAETFWEMRRRLDGTPGVTLLGAVSPERVIQEQLAAQVHLWPSDPPNVGSQIHGLSQVEAAAAGCALVLSDVEAFPEVFGAAAVILPTIGTFVPNAEPDEEGTRIGPADYAREVVELMSDPAKLAAASAASRALAAEHTWQHVVDRWLAMVEQLTAVAA